MSTGSAQADAATAALVPGARPAVAHGDKGAYFEGVQCLRFVAAAMVVITHSTFYAHERLGAGSAIWGQGVAGVNIFFVISGFVMMTTLPKFAGSTSGWSLFGLRRLARIVPLYWLVTTLKLIALLSAPALVLHSTLDWSYVVKSYFFIPAYNVDGRIEPLVGVGWTLLFEMFFYLLCTIALLLRVNAFIFCGLILSTLALGSYFRPDHAPALLMYLNPIMIEFVIGMAIARWGVSLRLPRMMSVALIGLGFAEIFFPQYLKLGNVTLSRSIPAGMIVLGVVALERHVRAWPRSAVFLGAASYSLYLAHPLIAPLAPTILKRLDLPVPGLSVVASLILALTASLIGFLLFERPVGDWLNRRISLKARVTEALPT